MTYVRRVCNNLGKMKQKQSYRKTAHNKRMLMVAMCKRQFASQIKIISRINIENNPKDIKNAAKKYTSIYNEIVKNLGFIRDNII